MLPDPLLVKAQLYCESGLNPKAKSHVGAYGLSQFMPSTWDDIMGDKDIENVEYQVYACCKYMRMLWLSKGIKSIEPLFPDRYLVALKSYNGGEKWQVRVIGILDTKLGLECYTFRQHQEYHKYILEKYPTYRGLKENTQYPERIWKRYKRSER